MELDDYYSILGVSKSATKEEIKRAYRALAARWDPDKNSDNIELAEEKFKQILQAYNILNRAAIEGPVRCSLEDLYNGASREMTVSNSFTYPSGWTRMSKKMVTIKITRGLAKGAKIILGGEVSKELCCPEIALVVDEKPHDVFTRDGMDLIATQKVTLVEALAGYTVLLATLDDRRLKKRIDSIIHPDYEMVVENEGMPSSEDTSKRGNLRIRFKVMFPTTLTTEQKAELCLLLLLAS